MLGSTMLITSLDRVKNLMRQEGPTDSKVDGQVDELISILSRRAEAVMGRPLLRAARVELFDVNPGQRTFVVAAPPIAASPTPVIESAADRDYTGSGSSYALDASDLAIYYDESGRVTVCADIAEGPQCLRISYTGGMALTTDALATAYPELVEMAALQVYQWWKQLPNMGKTTDGVIGVSYSTYKEVKLLDDFRAMLESLQRMSY